MGKMIELHMLQNFAPSCLNRDDTNTPKDCEFGGVRRARISSQCLKRAMREHFRTGNSVPVGERTKHLHRVLMEKLSALQQEPHLSEGVEAFLETYYSKMDGKRPQETAVLLFVGEPEIDEAAQCIQELWAGELKEDAARRTSEKAGKSKDKSKAPATATFNKAIAERLIEARPSVDIGLFGRMMAEQPARNISAAAQVAHAISTHRVDMDMDFYTAVDDLNPDEATGAGMMGVTGFNSACFYRYAVVDHGQLVENLGDPALADDAVAAFLRAAVEAIPTGKQNSMAAHNQPSLVMCVVRNGGTPVSLANAFADPVRVNGTGPGLIGGSITRLATHWQRLQQVYGSSGVLTTTVCSMEPETLGDLSAHDCGSLEATLNGALQAVRERP